MSVKTNNIYEKLFCFKRKHIYFSRKKLYNLVENVWRRAFCEGF